MHALLPAWLGTAVRFVAFVGDTLGVRPEPGHFVEEFAALGRGG